MSVVRNLTIANLSLLSVLLASAVVNSWTHGGHAQTVTTNLTFPNGIVYSGSYNTTTQEWLTVSGNSLTGTASTSASDGLDAPLHVYVGNDTVDTTTSGPGNLNILAVNHATAAGSTGGRTTILGSENIVGTPTTLSAAGYVGVGAQTRVSANMGGSTGAYANYKGNTFGGNSNVFTTSGATFIGLVNAHEFDVTLATGSSAAEKHGITVVQGANDAVNAAYDGAAFQFAAQDGATAKWPIGIDFGGGYAHQTSFDANSTFIGATPRTVGTASPRLGLYGIDWTNVTFTTGGAPFVMPLITPSSSSATCKTGAIVWDGNFIDVCVATNTHKHVALSTY